MESYKDKASAIRRVGERNQNERFSFVPIAIFIVITLIGWQLTVQAFGTYYHYHHQLGAGLIRMGDKVIYWPFTWIAWSYSAALGGTQMTLPIIAMHAGVAISLVIGMGVGFVLYYRRSLKTEKVEDIHGSAKFASDDDVRSMKLVRPEGATREPEGVIVGAYKFENGEVEFLRYNEPAHIFGAAPSRSGKGVSLVLPTLLTWAKSVFNNDVKRELFELSSGFRHNAGSLVMAFDPTYVSEVSVDGKSKAMNTVRWNALDEIRLWTEYDVMDAQNLARDIADPDAKGMDDHWVSTSYELLTGLFLHMCYAEPDKSLHGCGVYLADPQFSQVEQMFERMINAKHDPHMKMGWKDSSGSPTATHPVVATAAQAMLNKEEKERNSVLSTAKTRLSLYMEPIVARNTSVSDFRVHDIMNHNKPVSFYMIVPPSDKERLRPLVRLFIGFYLRRATASMRFEDGGGAHDYMHRLLMLIDELPALRKLDALQDSLGFAAGYGITAFMLVQDIPQLTSKDNGYGDSESIRSGSHVQIYFTPNTLETAKAVSEKLGQRTVIKQRLNYSGKRFSPVMDQMSVNEEDVKRALMEPDEVARMPADKSLIFIAGKPPIMGEKVPYYQVPELLRRASLLPPMRIGMSWRQMDKPGTPLANNWLMVSVKREENYLGVAINVYRDYPAVNATLKQLDLQTGVVTEFPVDILDDNGKRWLGELTEEQVNYQVQWSASSSFDPKEAFELHLTLKEKPDLPEFQETGFFAALSVYEYEARQLVRELMREEEKETKIEVKPRFISIRPDMVCLGDVVAVTDHCVIMRRGKGDDAFFVHRKELLDRLPKEGDRVMIRYRARRGTVENR